MDMQWTCGGHAGGHARWTCDGHEVDMRDGHVDVD